METFRIDPRDFISGPYVKCTKCGQETLGILGIHSERYTRRCRECWHTITIELPPIKKRVVYLDQSAISNMMKTLNPEVKGHKRTTEQKFWIRLFEHLEIVRSLQLVVCPESREHTFVSLLSPYHKPLMRICDHFSGGTSFFD